MNTIPKRRPTILDIAASIGMSPATVSNAITGARPVDGDTRARVLEAVRTLGYSPNQRARNLRTGRADTIAIFSSMPFAVAGGSARLGYLMEVAGAAAESALQGGLALVLVPPIENGALPLSAMHVDGALVVEPLEDDPEVRALLARNIPVVSIGSASPHAKIAAIDTQPYAAAGVLLDHLRQQGAKHIALITGAQDRHTHRETERRYRDDQGTARKRAIVRRIDETGGEAAGYEAARSLLQRHAEIDALLVSVDSFAAGALRAATQVGRDVPRDLKIATRYDGLMARQHDLTALDLHLPALGSLGVDLLIQQIARSDTPRSMRGPLPCLVARGSSVP